MVPGATGANALAWSRPTVVVASSMTRLVTVSLESDQSPSLFSRCRGRMWRRPSGGPGPRQPAVPVQLVHAGGQPVEQLRLRADRPVRVEVHVHVTPAPALAHRQGRAGAG